MGLSREYVCADCGSRWQGSYFRGGPSACPQCGGAKIQKATQGKGWAKSGKGSSKDRGRRWIR